MKREIKWLKRIFFAIITMVFIGGMCLLLLIKLQENLEKQLRYAQSELAVMGSVSPEEYYQARWHKLSSDYEWNKKEIDEIDKMFGKIKNPLAKTSP